MSKSQAKMTIAAAKLLAQGGPVTTQQLKLANAIVKDEIRKGASSSAGWSSVGSIWDRVKNRLGDALKIATVVSPMASLALTATQFANMKKSQAPAPVASDSGPSSEDSFESSLGFACCGGDELTAAMEGGQSEMAALARRTNLRGVAKKPPFYFPAFATVGDDTVPHNLYRAAIWQKATKMANGEAPEAKHIAAAQKFTNLRLSNAGLRVAIPGSYPGRVTR